MVPNLRGYNMLLRAAISGFFVVSACAQADMVNVYCSSLNSPNEYYWAKDDTGGQLEIYGEWQKDTEANIINFKGDSLQLGEYLLVNKNQFEKIKTHCNEDAGYVPQPGDTSVSGWYMFVTQDSNGQLELQPGTLKRSSYRPGRDVVPTTATKVFREPDASIVSHITTRMKNPSGVRPFEELVRELGARGW